VITPQTRLESLQGQIEAIRIVLEGDDLDALPDMIDHYEIGVRDLCALPEARRFGPQVRALRDSQQALTGLMQQRKAQLLELIRRQRQSSQAASAYAGAGMR